MLSLVISQHVFYTIYLQNTRIFCMFFQSQGLWLLSNDAFDMMVSFAKWFSKRVQWKLRPLFQASQPNQWESPILLMVVIYIYPVINTGSSTVWWSYIPSFVLFLVLEIEPRSLSILCLPSACSLPHPLISFQMQSSFWAIISCSYNNGFIFEVLLKFVTLVIMVFPFFLYLV